MKGVWVITALAIVSAVASASSPLEDHHVKDSTPSGVHYGSGRVEGDTIEEAWVIEALPFTDSDNTCGFNNDYDEVCPYSGSTSGDVVYAYIPEGDDIITIDLCYSEYDTKVYVYEDYWTPGEPYACNDDAHFSAPCYTYSSKIAYLELSAGHTYYIVVDGYGGDCGTYVLDILYVDPCFLECPDGALVEGEPPCVDEYQDDYNAGCGFGGGWTYIEAQEYEHATMCGKSCTFSYQGSSYRDTDWYTLNAAGGEVTVTCDAEFPVLFLLFYVIDYNCVGYEYLVGTDDFCEPVTLSHSFAAGQELWLWVAPSVFSGVPESDYILDITGILWYEPSPASEATWGSIKGMFK